MKEKTDETVDYTKFEDSVHYHLMVYVDASTEKVLMKIPFRRRFKHQQWKLQTITIFDSKRFKLKDSTPRKWSYKDLLEPTCVFAAIDIQGHEEGWFDPLKTKVVMTTISKELFIEKYDQYNEWRKK